MREATGDTGMIRGAEPADAARLLALWSATPDARPTAEFEGTLRAVLRNDAHAVFVIEAENELAACVHGAVLPLLGDARTLHLFSLLVAPRFRRSGMARRLLAVVETWANAQGCAACFASDRISFVGAAEFWRAVGYEHAATSQVYRKQLAI